MQIPSLWICCAANDRGRTLPLGAREGICMATPVAPTINAIELGELQRAAQGEEVTRILITRDWMSSCS
jgi:hypothetical protein